LRNFWFSFFFYVFFLLLWKRRIVLWFFFFALFFEVPDAFVNCGFCFLLGWMGVFFFFTPMTTCFCFWDLLTGLIRWNWIYRRIWHVCTECTKEGKAGGRKEGRKEGRKRHNISSSLITRWLRRIVSVIDAVNFFFFWRPRGSDLRRREGDRRNKKRVGGTVGEEVRHGVSLACVKTVEPLGMLDPNPGREGSTRLGQSGPARTPQIYVHTYVHTCNALGSRGGCCCCSARSLGGIRSRTW
jgi:hypothetical protein